MANPAELLHNILSEWVQPADKQIHSFRGLHKADATMKKHRQAIVLIEEIEQILAGMTLTERRRSSIERNLERWTRWVFAYPHNWTATPLQSNASLADQNALDALDLVAELLDSHVPKIDEARRNTYLESINEILVALASDESLPAELKQHIYTVAAHTRQCIEEYEMNGDFALQASVERLAASIQTAISVTKDPGVWQNFRDKFVYPTIAGIVASGPQLAITMGGGA